MVTRRDFLQASAAAGALVAMPWEITVRKAMAAPASAPPVNLTRWQDPLPIPPVLDKQGGGRLTIPLGGGRHQFHAQLPVTASPGPTTYGYGGAAYLGPTIEVRSGVPLSVTYDNTNLPPVPVVSSAIDTTLFRNGHATPHPRDWPAVRTVAHLHGGFTPPQYDGHPEAWSAPGTWKKAGAENDNNTGSHFVPGPFTYSNAQPASMLWYHDHAMGITRLNVYAGLAAFYIVRDDVDTGLAHNPLGLPAGAFEVPIVIQDRLFNPDGTLFYPTGNPAATHPIWIPELFGDIPVVNGKAYPYLEVEPRRYRLRLLNGSNARFYSLWFGGPIATRPHPFHVIGVEGGLLPAPVPFDGSAKLVMAPAERFDLIVDFSSVPGKSLTLMNDAKAPFPGGQGGQVNQVMQFRVVKPLSGADATQPASGLTLPPITPLTATPGAPLREIVLTEADDAQAPQPLHALLNERFFAATDPAGNRVFDEEPRAGTTEVWQFINTTGDAHPMHTHLVMFQVVDRRPFDARAYLPAYLAWVAAGRNPATKPTLISFLRGPAVPSPPEERGWKDTVKTMPGEVTRIVARFDLPPHTKLPAEYVYHCHILEHEDNEMMRPYRVTEAPPGRSVNTQRSR